MKRLLKFLRQYKLFSVAVLTLLAGVILALARQSSAAHWLLGGVSLAAVGPLAWSMWQAVRSGTYGIDILAITAIVAAVVLRQDWAAIVVLLMLSGGEALEHFAEGRAKKQLDALLANAPQQAHVLRGGKVTDIPAAELRVGDKFIIESGELVPADAIIIDGSANFDEASLTGESLPQFKEAGDHLLSGTVNLDAPVTAKALATAADSQYQQIVKLVRGAGATPAPFVRLADRYSLPFTFAAYALATMVWFFSGQAVRFLEVIIVATPCPLLLAAPIALISGMARASRYGIIVKTGSALERLAEARTIAFDKTGTLTKGELVVDRVTAFGSFGKDEVLGWAASLEQASPHAIAQAITTAARTKGLKFGKAKHVTDLPRRGLQAMVKGRTILIGRLSLLSEHDVALPTSLRTKPINQTAVYVAVDGQLAGLITFKDELRPETKSTLERLRALGIQETLMITGDNQTTAEAIARTLNITHVHADMLPADKMRVLEATTARPLIFVGDGVNDAPALTAADIGIALGARGSIAASESADMVIMPDDLGRMVTALTIAKRTFRIARQSILVGIALSLLLMLIFATGKFSPLAGAIVQEIVDITVIFNALRACFIKVEGQ